MPSPLRRGRAAPGALLLLSLLLASAAPLSRAHAAPKADAPKTVSAKRDGTPVRRAPAADAEPLFRVARHYPFEPLERKDAFTRVRDFEGETGWAESAALERRDACVATRRVEVRSGPDDARRALFLAERGASFRVLERKGGFVKVEHARGRTGYIRADAVWPAPPR